MTKHASATPLPADMKSINPLSGWKCAVKGCYFRKALDERQTIIDVLHQLCGQTFAAISGLTETNKAREHNAKLGEAHSRARALLRSLGEDA